MRRGTIGALAMVVLLTGCPRGRDAPPSDPPLPTGFATTVAETTTTTMAGFTVPAVIDVAYAQRVLDALHHLEGELARHLHRTKKLDAEYLERLDALYGGQELKVSRDEYAKDAAIGFAGYADPPGDPVVVVREVIDFGPRCMVVRADVDRQPLYANEVGPVGRDVIHDIRGAEILRLNPTGWGIVAAGAPRPGQSVQVCR